MTIQIQVFAVLKDYFQPSFELQENISDIGQLKSALGRINPGSENILKACRFAVNDQFVSADYKLNEHDKIVVLPPSSGG